MMVRLVREIISVVEAMVTETGRFGRIGPTGAGLEGVAASKPGTARLTEMPTFIGLTAQEALVERMAAD
jgi:hypothetical protein